MYIYRLVIDANRINVRGSIPAMNEIEAYHDAGVVEIVKTSTLPAELPRNSPFFKKAKKYFQIGHSGTFQIEGAPFLQAMPGAGARESRFSEIYQTVFGVEWRRKGPKQEHLDVNSMRDALHLDQCWINNVDYFITNENAMINANDELNKKGMDFKVCDADACLDDLKAYFQNYYKTTDINALSNIVKNRPPVILGSNTCGNVKLVDIKTEEILFESIIEEDRVKLFLKVYSSNGKKLLTIAPDQEFSFEESDIRVRMMSGPAHLQLGKKTCKEFSISFNGICFLAARQLNTGLSLFYKAIFNNKYGETIAQIDKKEFSLKGGNLLF
jgi:hypothetical protein